MQAILTGSNFTLKWLISGKSEVIIFITITQLPVCHLHVSMDVIWPKRTRALVQSPICVPWRWLRSVAAFRKQDSVTSGRNCWKVLEESLLLCQFFLKFNSSCESDQTGINALLHGSLFVEPSLYIIVSVILYRDPATVFSTFFEILNVCTRQSNTTFST